MSEAQTHLRGYLESKAKIKRYEMQIEELRASQIMPSKNDDGMPHGKNGHTDLSDYIVKLEKLEQDRAEAIARMMQECQDILDAIETAPDEMERMVLSLRYIQGLRWEEIWQVLTEATDKDIKLRRVYQIHGNALQHIRFEKK